MFSQSSFNQNEIKIIDIFRNSFILTSHTSFLIHQYRYIQSKFAKVNGTCKTFTACADATKDKLACTTNPTCKWTENSAGTSCANHTCDTFATGTDCQPIPSFDGASSTVCVLQSGKCAAADPGTMTDSKICYTKSAYTYSWNAATNKCESCIAGSVTPNNSNSTNNGTDNGTTTDSAYILSVISLGLLGLMA